MVDPELAPLLEGFPEIVLSGDTLGAVRAMFGAPNPEVPEPCIEPERVMIERGSGAPDVPVLIFDPPGRTGRSAIVHIHGGGMVMGSAAAGATATAELARSAGVMIVSVDYRLAPETPFPGPQEDCLAAVAWVARNAKARNINPSRIAVMGESAGGGLAASVALMARDRQGSGAGEGGVAICGQILTYPMLDHRTGTAEQPGLPHTGEFVWTRHNNQFGWQSLRGDYACADHRAGWFSPALALDMSRLPPTFVATGALDLFLEEDLKFVGRLAGAGVPVECHVYPGAFHGFNVVPGAQMTRNYNRDLTAAIARMLTD